MNDIKDSDYCKLIPTLKRFSTNLKESIFFRAGVYDSYTIDSAIEEIERLRKERDAARREVLEGMHPDLRHGYAAAKEWEF